MSSSFGRRFRLSPQAIQDLIQIYNHLHARDPFAAYRLTSGLEQKIRDPAGFRNPGVSRDWVKPGLRAFSYRHRCIYFRVVDDMLAVLPSCTAGKTSHPNDFPESDP